MPEDITTEALAGGVDEFLVEREYEQRLIEEKKALEQEREHLIREYERLQPEIEAREKEKESLEKRLAIAHSLPNGVMPLDEILETLSRNRKPFPEEAMLSAVVWQEEITPKIIEAMQHLVRHAGEDSEEDENQLWFYGLFLLAEFREKKAFEPLLAICRLPEDQVDRIFGDLATESLPGIFRSLCHGDTESLIALVEDEAVNPWVRTSAIRALQGEAEPCSELEADLRERYRIQLERAVRLAQNDGVSLSENGRIVLGSIGLSCAEMYFRDLLPLLDEAYHSGALDTLMSWESYERYLSPDLPEEDRARNRSRHQAELIDSAADELRNWACFQVEKPHRSTSEDWTAMMNLAAARAAEKEEYEPIRSDKKIGPNKPCPCGSGKKHKKCCGR